jgi:hypothetical protein
MSCKHLTGFEAQRYSDTSSNGVVGEAITASGAQDCLVQISYDENNGDHVNLDAYGPLHSKLRVIRTFWGVEHLRAVWVADAGSFCGV